MTAVVRAGAMIWGKMTARFQMPIVVASAPGGNTRHAIAQSAARKMPHPKPAATVAVGRAGKRVGCDEAAERNDYDRPADCRDEPLIETIATVARRPRRRSRPLR